MKKRKLKKLVLHRETLVELTDLRLVGGATGYTAYCGGTGVENSCPEACQWSGRNTCTTCELTCTTNYC